jgi:NAD+ diphosphatase
MEQPNFYAGSHLDRAHRRRSDPDWLKLCLAEPGTRIVPVWRNLNLVRRSERVSAAWLPAASSSLALESRESVLLGIGEGAAHVAVDLSDLSEEALAPIVGAHGEFVDLRTVGPLLGAEEGALLAYARGIAFWHARHGFCGNCGSSTLSAEAGHVRRCVNASCGISHFPRTDPAVIMLVTRGDQALLGRQPSWPPGMHSTLAGFVEPGEALEEAVAREVMEEVGIRVRDVRYRSSQPWPFPASIMLGFTAVALDVAIHPEPGEIEFAGWFSREDLRRSPENEAFKLPRRDSIARRLIEGWLGEA